MTFKPWVNLVWIGVLIAVSGTLLAMLRRTLDARKIDKNDKGDLPPTLPTEESEGIVDGQPWDLPDAPASPPGTALPITVKTKPATGRLKTAKQ